MSKAGNIAPPSAGVPTFAPAVVGRQLAADRAICWLTIGAMVVVLALSSFWESLAPNLSTVVTVGVAGAWVALSMISTRVRRQMPRITLLLEQDPAAAESAIAAALRRRPLRRSVRLLLYHRLAVLRYRQHRYAEAAAICQAVLAQKLGTAASVRGNLLLMLAESRLECGDPAGAYVALADLAARPLSLIESLQRLHLQTRYEIACGYDAQALSGLAQKLDLAELMPHTQAARMHHLLAMAATRAHQTDLAQSLTSRAALLDG